MPRTVLTEEQVENIYWRYQQGGNTYQSLANEYGVEVGTVSAILRGRTWAWLTGGSPARKPPTPPPSHCGKGHEFTEYNTMWVKRTADPTPHRQCRLCTNRRKREYDRRKRGNFR